MRGTIVLPGQVEGLVRRIKQSTHCKKGPRYTRLVGLALQRVCLTFQLDPAKLADQVTNDVKYSSLEVQVAFVEYECMWPTNSPPQDRPGDCSQFLHLRGWGSFCPGKHWQVLIFGGTAVEVCSRLNALFDPATSNKSSKAAAEGIVPSEIGSLEDRVGLTDFVRGL